MRNVLNYLLTKIIIQTKVHSQATVWMDKMHNQENCMFSSYVLEKLIFYFYNLKMNSMERYDLA